MSPRVYFVRTKKAQSGKQVEWRQTHISNGRQRDKGVITWTRRSRLHVLALVINVGVGLPLGMGKSTLGDASTG